MLAFIKKIFCKDRFVKTIDHSAENKNLLILIRLECFCVYAGYKYNAFKPTTPTEIYGDTSKLRGDFSGLRGDVSGLTGDFTGVYGDASNVSLNLDKVPVEVCNLIHSHKRQSIEITIEDILASVNYFKNAYNQMAGYEIFYEVCPGCIAHKGESNEVS